METTRIQFAFFGSSRFSVTVLDRLAHLGFIPACIITTPDKPQGRKLVLTPNIVKVWAINKGIKVYDPEKLDIDFIAKLRDEKYQLFVVASYGKILPKALIEIPEHETLNIHPSLLPKYRGASPLQSAMLDDTKTTGVSIMKIDEAMDHGPIIAQKEIALNEWPAYEEFENLMAREGAELLATVMPHWVSGSIQAKDQDHNQATYTKKINKEDGRIDFSEDPYLNFRKIQAYHEWPQAYFLISHAGKNIRVKITTASFKNGTLFIEKVIPEGSKEMTYSDFQSGYMNKNKS